MKNYFYLELRKDRLTLAGLAATFLVSLPLAAWAFRINGLAARDGLDAVLLFWIALGLPLSALVFAGAGGAGLRSPATRAVEDFLPLSPLRRSLAAAAACAALTLALAALVFAALTLRDSAWWVPGPTLGSGAPMFAAYLSVAALTTTYLFALAFCVSYGIGHGIVGAAAAALLGGATTAAVTSTVVLHALGGIRAPLWGKLIFVGLLAAAGLSVAWRRLAAWVERRPRGAWKGLGVIVPGLLAGALPAVVCFAVQLDQTLRWRELCGPMGGGVIMRSLNREIDWIMPDGKIRVLAPAEIRDVAGLLESRFFFPPRGWFAVDGKRVVWILKYAGSGRYDLWTGADGAPLARAQSFAGSIPELREGRPPLVVDFHDHDYVEAPVAPGRPLAWRPSKKGWKNPAWPESLKELTADGEFYGASGDENTSTFSIGAGRHRTETKVERSQGGPRLFLLRASADALWIMKGDGDEMMMVDRKTGAALKRWPMPGDLPRSSLFDGERWAATPGGVFSRGKGAVWFVDWDGRARRLAL